jgi:hypothetical protein
MELYFTDAIGFSRPGKALIMANSADEVVEKVHRYIEQFPQYRLFKTEMVTGEESDTVDHVVKVKKLQYQPVSSNVKEIDLLDCGGLNEDVAIGNQLNYN